MKRLGMLLLSCGLAAASLLPVAASAAYNDECRAMAQRLATDPGSLKVGELDLLKSCLSDLQRSVVLGEPPPAKGELPACAAQPAACPVCPAATACPAAPPEASSAPATPAVPANRAKPSRERAREDDRRLKPYLPTY